MGKKNKSADLFDAVARSIETIGIDNTVKALENAHDTHFKSYKERISFLIEISCEQFNVNKAQLTADRLRDDTLKTMGCIFVILRDKLKYTPSHISKLFGKHISNVTRAIKKIDELDEKISIDRETKVKFEKIKELYEKTFK